MLMPPSWIFALLAAALLAAGCATPRSSPVLEARGIAAIEGLQVQNGATTETLRLDWAGDTLSASATVPLDAAVRAESESLALASARLAARDQVRTEIERQVDQLPVRGSSALGETGTEIPTLAARIAGILGDVGVVETSDNEAATASVELPLGAIADAVIEAAPTAAPESGQSSVILAEAAAQRVAFERARTELRGKLFSTRIRGGANIDALLRKYPAEQPAVQAWLFNARTLSSRRLADDRWEIILQADATPVIRRFELLEDATRNR